MSADSLNVAIFGGSFNPPHSGHRAIIERALKCEFIDLLIILPNFKNPLKNSRNAPFLSDEARIKLLQKMIDEIALDSADLLDSTLDSAIPSKNSQNLPKILLSNYEISQKKPSFSIDSILHFKQIYAPKNLYFIIGADILSELDKWHKIDEIRQNARFIIATRGDIPIPSGFLRFQVSEDISSSAIRANQNFKDFVAESSKNHTKDRDLDRDLKVEKTTQNRLDKIIELLESKKAEDVALFDLRQTPYITSFVIIATALADKHSFALLDYLKTELKASGEHFYSTDEESGDWIIADLGDIMIHIFTENHRKKFNLEEFLSGFKRAE